MVRMCGVFKEESKLKEDSDRDGRSMSQRIEVLVGRDCTLREAKRTALAEKGDCRFRHR
jgi:hypothetical protein